MHKGQSVRIQCSFVEYIICSKVLKSIFYDSLTIKLVYHLQLNLEVVETIFISLNYPKCKLICTSGNSDI